MFTPADPKIVEADLPPGGRVCTAVNGQAVVVFNLDAVLYAIANTCPHAGRPLEDGELRGKVITCPFHGYNFNIATGANLDFPDIEPPVVTFAARFNDGVLEIDPQPASHA